MGELGPYAPFTKQPYVYASGWLYSPNDAPSQQTSDASGPFSHTCCVSVETSAGAEPTFTPVLEGAGYIFGLSGCEAPRYYRAWNY